jgi:hypothetical protein
MRNTIWTLFLPRGSRISLPGLGKLALNAITEAIWNVRTRVLRTVNESRQQDKGFRDFQHELDSKLWNGGLPDEESYH